MAEIVSHKFWVKVSRKDIEDYIRTVVPNKLCDFNLVEVQTVFDDHGLDTVTFGLSYIMPTGPLS